MKSLLIAAALVGLSAGVPFTADQVLVCSSNANCRQYGDTTATCCNTNVFGTCPTNTAATPNKCVCTATGANPFGFFTDTSGNSVNTCLRVADSQALKAGQDVTAVLTLTYNAGDCSQIGTFRTEYTQRIQGYFQTSNIVVDAIEHSCATTGSTTGVYTAMRLSMKLSDLVSPLLLTFPDAALTLLTTTNLRLLGATTNQQSLMLADAVPSFCTLPTSGATTLQGWFGGTNCRDITCSSGFIVTNGACVADTGSTLSASDVHVCSTHTDCRMFGDPNAACVVPSQQAATASCVCSPGFSQYTDATTNAIFRNCFPTASGNLINGVAAIDVIIGMTFNTANCAGIDTFGASFLNQIESIFDTEPTMAVKLITHHCSTTRVATQTTQLGVDSSIRLRMQVKDLFVGAFTAFPGSVLTRLVSVPTLDARFGRSFNYKSAYFLPSIARFCPDTRETRLRSHFGSRAVTGVSNTATATPICKDMLCNAPYVSDASGVCTIPVVPFVDNSDDEISGGAIAGIVVGCLSAIVIVIFLIYWCCCRSEDEEHKEM